MCRRDHRGFGVVVVGGGSGAVVKTDGIMNSAEYQNLVTSTRGFRLGHT